MFWQLTVVTSTHENPKRKYVKEAVLEKVATCADALMCLIKMVECFPRVFIRWNIFNVMNYRTLSGHCGILLTYDLSFQQITTD